MLVKKCVVALTWAIGTSISTASIAPLNNNIHVTRDGTAASPDSVLTLRRAIASTAQSKRDTVKSNTTLLDNSWNDVVLFDFDATVHKGNTTLSAGIKVICKDCYVRGTATTQFTVPGNFNASRAFDNVTSEVKFDTDNIWNTFVDATENYTKNYTKNLPSDIFSGDFEIDDLDFPTIPFDLQLAMPEIPECQLRYQFDGLELYMQIDTILTGGATYQINLFTTESPVGIKISDDFEIGVIFTIDLILSAEVGMDISSGFHIKLHDGAAINIAMFSKNVSSITSNGGDFEFLPVTIQSGGVVLTALLRVGVHAGFHVATPSELTIAGIKIDEASAGVEVGVWIDVAEFVTNVTKTPKGDTSGCELRIVEAYSLALGANAGATVSAGLHHWGPAPNTRIPIFYTTLADACAVSKPATAAVTTATAIGAVDRRDASSTTSTVTYTATSCMTTGLVDCPASLQSTSTYSTVTSALKYKAASTSSTQATVTGTVAFGTNAKAMTSSDGTPVSYIPPPTSTSRDGDGNDSSGDDNKAGHHRKVVIGICVGLVMPILVAIIAGAVYFFYKRKRYSAVSRGETAYLDQQGSEMSGSGTAGVQIQRKEAPQVATVEIPQVPERSISRVYISRKKLPQQDAN
ncbi:hypothetical protein LSUB1_G002141 [Lachnellula subtilissima]|uniref:Mid2 domain-containing protein n=1 Tax=Lachnellula subtilissima TaxID=602034 RepID=A0A8H8RQW2_9HELO|nr:hypothetical protein LSUB1_G002141 [Lachnellula subtilissima]